MSAYFFDEGLKKVLSHQKLFLFFDFDGTLVPIQKDPALCYLFETSKNILEKIAREPFVKVAIISGRNLEDLKSRVSIDGVFYAGSHGLEIYGPGLVFVHEGAIKLSPFVNELYKRLFERIGDEKGIFMEKKPFSFTVHLRIVEKKRREKIKNIIASELKKYDPYLKIQKGKLVFEIITNVDWDKSKAVSKIMECEGAQFFPAFFGDDLTDEHVFKKFRDKGVMVKVGKSKKTEANYYVKNQKEVIKFLKIFSDKKHE